MRKLYEEENIRAIANAIRLKNGTEETYKPSEMASAIEGIKGSSDWIDRSITTVASNVEAVGDYALAKCAVLTSADFPLAQSVGTYAFYGCDKLATINFPLIKSIGSMAFGYCYELKNVVFPNVESVGDSAFVGCKELVTADFPKTISIGNYGFRYNYSLKALILRSTTLCTLAATTAFQNCYHIYGAVDSQYNPSGLRNGYIYVPSALVSTYKANSVWASFASQIRALENYTVDGTLTGELDETKV